ncbi:MAG: hypothetical protein K8S97_08995 [Anaerolineae bacterium]|nr:hypothetical protein [Anaerolineae bacterium]
MPQQHIFRWRAGSGWLVLSGGGSNDSDDGSSIAAHMLGHTLSQGPIAYIWAANDLDTADAEMDALRELGARTGYLVDIVTEENDVLFTQISEAGVIILGAGPHTETLYDALAGVALDSILQAFAHGATIFAIGQSAALWGAFREADDTILPGLNWLDSSLIMPGYTPAHADLLRACITESAASYGLGLGEGAAIAFGPHGEIEVWGNRAITITLGQEYDPDV